MDIVIEIAGIDRTSLIEWKSVSKQDYETTQVDTFAFKYLKYGSRSWVPGVEDEIIVTDDDTATRIFGGRIVSLSPTLLKNGNVDYAVKCKDYTIDLDDELVAETYDGQTAAQIIADILPVGFTNNNVVGGAIVIERIQFNYQKKSDVIKTLADLLGYHWYVDYTKDIHFFPKTTESAPFGITDSSANLLSGSLSIDIDHAQLRNTVYILGGETVGASRTEEYKADGLQDHFPLANKFSDLPVVKKNTVPLAVGVAPLESFADGPYDVLWNFNEKYVQFNVKPTNGDTIDIVGTPLAQIAVKIDDPVSVLAYGVREFRIEDKTIQDTDTARQRGVAELDAYAEGVTEGSFRTYTSGLRSGMYINVNSAALGINEDYMIKNVMLKMFSHDTAIYTVSLVSKRTVGIIELLVELLKTRDKISLPAANAIITEIKSINENVNVDEEISVFAEKADHRTIDIDENVRKDPWGAGVVTSVYAPYFPSNDADPKRPGNYDANSRYG